MKNSVKYNDKLNVIGPVIRKYREQANLSQRLESGDRIIKDYELAAISKILNVSTDTLLKDFLDKLK